MVTEYIISFYKEETEESLKNVSNSESHMQNQTWYPGSMALDSSTRSVLHGVPCDSSLPQPQRESESQWAENSAGQTLSMNEDHTRPKQAFRALDFSLDLYTRHWLSLAPFSPLVGSWADLRTCDISMNEERTVCSAGQRVSECQHGALQYSGWNAQLPVYCLCPGHSLRSTNECHDILGNLAGASAFLLFLAH